MIKTNKKPEPNKDTLEPTADLNTLRMYQPTRALAIDLSKPSSTSDLVGKLAQLGQNSGSSKVVVSNRVIASGSGSTGGTPTAFKVNGIPVLSQSPINIVGDGVTIDVSNPIVGNVEIALIPGGLPVPPTPVVFEVLVSRLDCRVFTGLVSSVDSNTFTDFTDFAPSIDCILSQTVPAPGIDCSL